jgi:hypothetical protein
MSKEKKEIEVSVEEQKLVAAEEAIIAEAEGIKAKYKLKKVFRIEVENEETGEFDIIAYLRKPNLKEFTAFTTIAEKGDKISALKMLLTNVFVEGNKLVLSDDDYFLAALSQIEEIINVQASRIKKF